jgi:3-oxoacyl-[acyl-carrier protein] reductase
MFTPVEGRSVLVTGSSKGIGRGIAGVFAKAGAKVLVVARKLADAQEAADAFTGAGGTASAFPADVNDLAAMTAAADAAAERHGGLDVVCANAGIFPQSNIEDMDPAEWDDVLGTNLRGTFITVKAALPHLKKSDAGRVIVTSSITGPITGFPGWTHYGASKAGQLGFIRTACIELAKYGITVNAVLPGNVVTEGLVGLGDAYMETMAASIPLRKLGTVEDIGNAALFLATKEAGFITGQTIVIDGGQTLPESLEALE